MPQMNMVQAINDALRLEMRRDDRVVVLGEDVGKVGGVFRVTQGLFDEFGDDRVIDTPLTEGGIIGAAIGMALYGLVPVPEIQFADFIFPAYDQIVSELAKYRYRSGGEYPAKMVIRTPVGGGIRGGHYHSQSPESLVHPRRRPQGRLPVEPVRRQGPACSPRSAIPIRCCSSSRSASTAPPRARCPRATTPCRSARRAIVARGQATSRSLAWGAMLYEALAAADEGGRAGHRRARSSISARSGRVDIDTIVASVKKTGRVVVVHEAPKTLRLRRRARRARQREGVPPPRGAAGARDRLRHAVPVHARDGVPAARAPHPAGARRDGEVTEDESDEHDALRVQAAGHRRRRHRGRDRRAGSSSRATSSRKTSRWSR